MRKIIQFVTSVAAAAALLAPVFVPSVISAQESGVEGNGIKASPVRTELVINPGESRTITLTVQNITRTSADYQSIINDFVTNGEEGQPALILDADKFAPSHSLKRYITPIPNTHIPAGESREIKVTISIPKDAAGGGYYGAVRFTPAGSQGERNVTLSASVAPLLLVKVPGDIKEDMSISSFDVRRGSDGVGGSSIFMTNKDLFSVVRFENKGNVHEQPFGKVRLLKDGKVLQETEINASDTKANVLPDSIRRFSTPLDKVGSFGKYTVEGNFGYGSDGQLLTAKTSFWVIPLALIIAAVVGLVLVLLLIFGLPRAVKNYNKRVVRRANKR